MSAAFAKLFARNLAMILAFILFAGVGSVAATAILVAPSIASAVLEYGVNPLTGDIPNSRIVSDVGWVAQGLWIVLIVAGALTWTQYRKGVSA